MAKIPSHDEIQDAVHNRQAWGTRVLQQIVAIDSIAPNEQACQYALAEILRGEGLPIELFPLDNGKLRSTDGFIDFGLPLDNRPNLITFIGKSEGGRSLILNSHIDTVNWVETAHKWDAH